MSRIHKKGVVWRILDVRGDKDGLIAAKEGMDSLIHIFLVNIFCILPSNFIHAYLLSLKA